MNPFLLLILTLITVACSGQHTPTTTIETQLAGDTVSEAGGNIRCVLQDSRNNLWIATNGQGIYKYDGRVMMQYTDKHGLCSNYAWTISESKDGKIWIRTRDGICYFSGKEFVRCTVNEPSYAAPTVINENTGLLSDHYYNETMVAKIKLPETSPINRDMDRRFHYDVYATCRDSKGTVWFGTCTAGVCRYDGKTYTWLTDTMLGAPVRAIFEDSKGNIWMGNNGYGLFRYDGKTLTNFTEEHKLGNPDFISKHVEKEGTMGRVWSIAEDKQGNLWIGTIDAGVWMYDGKNLINYTTKDGLGSNAVWTIYKDKSDELWFGTDGSGLYKLDGKRFSRFHI